MIINELDEKIKNMKELQKLDNLKANQKQQESSDLKYHNIVNEVNEIVLAFDYLQYKSKVVRQENLKYSILDLLNRLNVATESGLVGNDCLLILEKKLKTIKKEYNGKWPKIYSSLTNAKISTLKVIRGIDTETVSKCLEDIEQGEDWNPDIEVFQRMIEGLESADQLISNLGLNQEIISFLHKINQGKATLPDLSDDVLEWIKKESLEAKIKISFRSGK